MLNKKITTQDNNQTTNSYGQNQDVVLVSLVVCTRNRAHFLHSHLASITAITSTVLWEIIFVDNNSSDETPKILAEFANLSSVPVSIVHEKIPGLSKARNAGWRQSNAKIIAFTDDDCYPDPDFINKVAEAFLEKNISFTGGRVLLHDPNDLPTTIKLSDEFDYINPYSFIWPGTIHGANFAFTKKLLEDVGGFDPLMGAGTPFPCEDCDILLRASNNGMRGKYCPNIVVSHHHRRRTPEDLAKLDKAYLEGRGAYFMKALVDLQKPGRTARMWYYSAKMWGLNAFVKEVYSGINYLLARKKATKMEP